MPSINISPIRMENECASATELDSPNGVPVIGLLESLLEAVSYGVIVLDADERVLLWGGWLEKVSGLAYAAVRGRRLVEIFPELAASRILSAVDSALRQGFPSILSQSLNKSPFPLFAKVEPAGTRQRIQQKVNVRPLRAAKPSVSGVSGVSDIYCLIEIFDVSLAVHREKILEEKKAFLKSILDSEPECVMVLSSAGEVVQMNKAGLSMLEVANLDTIRRKGLLDFVLPLHRATFSEMIRRVSVGDSDTFEFAIEGDRGTQRWLDTNATPLYDARGMLTGLLAVSRDITASKQAEAELEQYRQHLESLVEQRTLALSIAKEAAEAASRAKSTFLANMSHELRTPMNAIMGMTTLALRRATDSRQVDQLSKVTEASQRLLGIINDILDISKIEAERLSLEQIDFTLGSVLSDLRSLIAQKAVEKNLELRIELAAELAGQTLQGDPLRLGQILLNLASNAIKFTAAGGVTICVLPSEVAVVADSDLELDSDPDSAKLLLRFEVRDSGIGILPEDQKRLFTAFEQADGSTTRKFGGTGLGLAISKRLVQMMGGSIGVESQHGIGSTFWFTVRLESAKRLDTSSLAPSRLSAEERLKTRYSGLHILLVEDEPVNREVASGLLEDTGFRVDLAVDGIEAVERVSVKDYDLILMDMQMPNMNGVEATKAIRRMPGQQRTPILAMTANAFEEDRQICIAAGMDDHIAKPLNLDLFFETLLKWLSKTK